MDIDWTEDNADWDLEQLTRCSDTWEHDCPIGNPQRERRCIGYREREPGRLQLRVPLGVGEGVCQAIVDEHDEVIYVRVLVCYEDGDEQLPQDYCNCPVHVYLDRPLGDRKVIDADERTEVPLYEPHWASQD